MANEMIMTFGTTDTVISHAATLADASNTYDGGSTTQTEFDNSTDLYPYARAVLEIPETFAAAPDSGATVELYMTRNEIDGTDDEVPVPGAADLKNAHYVGQWNIDDSDVAHHTEIVISLVGVEKCDFYIKNNTGQTISYSATPTTVKITPFTYEPAA